MTRNTTIQQLVEVAYRHGKAKASNGRWWAERVDDTCVDVGHFGTRMMRVNVEKRTVEGLNQGWGSMTDKIGIGQILRYEGLGEHYRDVFPDDEEEMRG